MPLLDYDPVASGDLREIVPGQYAVSCSKPGERWDGWLFYRHPDGQWVSLRKMEHFELEALSIPDSQTVAATVRGE